MLDYRRKYTTPEYGFSISSSHGFVEAVLFTGRVKHEFMFDVQPRWLRALRSFDSARKQFDWSRNGTQA